MKTKKYLVINAATILLILMVIIILNSHARNIKPVVDLSSSWTISDGSRSFIDDFKYNSEDKIEIEKVYTITKSFTIPDQYKNQSLGLRIGNIPGAYKIYLNNVFLGQSGEIKPNYKNGWMNLGFYFLPETLIKYDKENVIKLEYYPESSSGFVKKPIILTYDNYNKMYFISRFLNYTIYIVILTLLLAISVFFIYIYSNSIKEKYIMYFSIITGCLFIYYLGYMEVTSNINYTILLKVTESAFFAAIILTIYFVKSYLGMSINRFDRLLHHIQMSVIALSFLIPKISIYNSFRRIFYIVIFINMFYLIYISIKAVLKKVPNSKYIFTLLVIAILFFIHDSISFIIPSITENALILDFSISVFIIPAIVINLALSFALKIEELQSSTVQYSDKLKNLNHMLKNIIDENNVLYSKTITDHLTGTYNRGFLEVSYKNQMEEMKTEDSYALFFLDIDNFRDFNNNYGHEVGDFVLVSFVNTINEILEPIDIFVRYSGDEFVILLYNNEPFRYKKVADKILDGLHNSKFEYNGKEYKISCSIGIKLLNNNSISLENVLKLADMAMYRAKTNGKSSYHILE